ncbi:hypothetical protein RHMOL_Rhmol09G0167000 [Rhododendron molle]|uniref:Uncharacterized protein n=1 Tax=Rhododendron molle TaxID=49168 RepID=A0ACC0MDY2_RHOML|nr:hypothetical protein RHMOL_Rhmol09G0167000 [Rhododendron molle]
MRAWHHVAGAHSALKNFSINELKHLFECNCLLKKNQAKRDQNEPSLCWPACK